MSEIHHEYFEQKPDHEDSWHLDTTRLSPADFLREEERLFKSEPVRDEAITLLKAKFHYIRDIMSDRRMSEAQRTVAGLLNKKNASRQ